MEQGESTSGRVVLVRVWPDPVIDTLGYDPRSLYVEKFWLPVLGPTSVLLLRHLAQRFAVEGDEIELPIAATASALGLGPREGRDSPLVRSLVRLGHFRLAIANSDAEMAVRRTLPPLTTRQVRRLTPELRDAHSEWLENRRHPDEVARDRARRMALVLGERAHDQGDVEHALVEMGFRPAVCREAVRWAEAQRSVVA